MNKTIRYLPCVMLATACGAPQAAPPPGVPLSPAGVPTAPAEPIACGVLPDPQPHSSADSALLNQLEKVALERPQVASTGTATVKVGVLHALTGSMARDESVLAHMVLATIESINRDGGVLGRRVEPVVVDPTSNWPITGQAAIAFHEQGVNPIFGLSVGIEREYVKRTMRPGDLLFYPAQYEGGEKAMGFSYTGAGLNQQAVPAVEYLMSLGKRAPRRWAVLGTDHSYPRKAGAVLKALLESKGIGQDRFLETYVPFGHRDFHASANAINRFAQGEDTVVFTFLVHDSNSRFADQLEECANPGLRVMSFAATRDDLAHPSGKHMVGQLVATSYLAELDNPSNSAFKKMWRDYVTAKALPTQLSERIEESMESSFVGVQLWKRAVEAAKSFDGKEVERALADQSLMAPSGYVAKLDPRTRDAYRPLFIGEVQPDASIKLLHSSGRTLPP